MSNTIELKLEANGRGAFVIEESGVRLAEMSIAIASDNMTVFHTEISNELRGQGIAAKLLSEMVRYARQHNLKVIPLCPYVDSQFKKYPALYEDVWNQNWHNKTKK